MKISVSSYSFHQRIKTGEMTQLDTVSAAAKLGFDGIEFTDLRPNLDQKPTLDEQLQYAEQIRKEAEKCGIAIVGYAIGADLYQGSEEKDAEEIERICGQLRVAAALGAPLLRHDACNKNKIGDRVIGFDRMLPTIAKNARAITEYAATLGIRTCTENHGTVIQDSDRVERLFHAVDHDNYGLLVDVGNFACADEDSVHAVSRLAPYAIHAHAKDFIRYPFGSVVPEGVKPFHSRARNSLLGCAIGDGDIPVAQCIAILQSVGYDGYVSIEFEGSKPCMEELVKGLNNLKSYVAAVQE